MGLQTQHDPKNEAEITYWNSAGGRRWVERQQSQDIVLGPILQVTLERAQLRQGERVVDIGCSTGASSIALAEPAAPDTVWRLARGNEPVSLMQILLSPPVSRLAGGSSGLVFDP
jgi:hypothetical protein